MELRRQQNDSWCAPASAETVLWFFRYEYDQATIAAELNQGTPAAPAGFDSFNPDRIGDVLRRLSSNALEVVQQQKPDWHFFKDAIDRNHPVIGMLSSHVHVVAGYDESWQEGDTVTPRRRIWVLDPLRGPRWQSFGFVPHWMAFAVGLVDH